MSDPVEPSDSTPEPSDGIRFQDPDTATPRPSTVAESRQRDRFRKEREARRIAEIEKAQQEYDKKQSRKKKLIAGGVTLGLVAVVAAAYAGSRDDNLEEAQCIDSETKIVMPAENCSTNRGYNSGGMFFFYGGGGRQYQYYYGSNAGVGQKATGGSLKPQPGTNYANSAGKKVTPGGKTGGPVSRGGFGSKAGGSVGKSSGS